MTQFGCRDSAVVYVNVDFGMTEFIPSAFTPNGDGRNDVFRILNMKYQKLLDFRVYNRWGQQIFQTTDVSKGWDGTFNGTPQDMGVYNYVIIVARPDGTEKTYTGAVSLIR
jgi:gliding motility-associated-like protein